MNLFTEPAERAKAMGVYGFVCAGGGSIGVLLGGILTERAQLALDLPRQPADRRRGRTLFCAAAAAGGRGSRGGRRLDVAGAVTVTASLMLAVYAIVNGNQAGWTSAQTLGLLGGAVALLALFLGIESRVASPLMPLRPVPSAQRRDRERRRRALGGGDVRVVLPLGALPAARARLQPAAGRPRVPAGEPDHGGVLARPLGEDRHALRHPAAARRRTGCSRRSGSLLFARAPVDGSFVVDVLPGMLLLGLGAGIAFNPVLLAAMSDVAPEESGLASGVVNTSFMMGGALGLAVLASLAAARTDSLTASGEGHLAALTAGYHLAFLVGALFALGAAAIGVTLFRTSGALAGARRWCSARSRCRRESLMFKDTNAFSGFSVDHLDRAKQFYGETLGLGISENPAGLELLLGNGTRGCLSTPSRTTSPRRSRSSTSWSRTSRGPSTS